MARFLFTTILADDLGVPTRSMPIALELESRGHDVAFCNPLNAPARFIESAGIENLPLPPHAFPTVFAEMTPHTWNLDHLMSIMGGLDEVYVRESVASFIELIESFEADVVVDSFTPNACVAARASGTRLATIIQADLHPSNEGFIWWEEKPEGVPSPVSVLNAVLSEYQLDPIASTSDLIVGDLTLCAGIPETDPVPGAADVVHMGPMFTPSMEDPLPDWVGEFAGSRTLVWVYCGNPRYVGAELASPVDSIVVLRAVRESLADRDVCVIMTAGFQRVPEEILPLPDNFRNAEFLPGLSLARRCDLTVHHGGHGSCMTGAFSGTPALIVPTYSERESNARRLAQLGVAEVILPEVVEADEKHVSSAEFGEKAGDLLSEPAYRAAAEALSKKMDGYGGSPAIADHVEALLQ